MEWLINITVIKWDISYMCESLCMITIHFALECEYNQEFHTGSMKCSVLLSTDEVMNAWLWEKICQSNWVWGCAQCVHEVINWQIFQIRVWLMTVSLLTLSSNWQHRLQFSSCYGIGVSYVMPHGICNDAVSHIFHFCLWFVLAVMIIFFPALCQHL